MRVIREGTDGATVQLSGAELGALSNALKELLHGPDAIAKPELPIRIGIADEEARTLLAELGSVVR
jgi:hypothetical protein